MFGSNGATERGEKDAANRENFMVRSKWYFYYKIESGFTAISDWGKMGVAQNNNSNKNQLNLKFLREKKLLINENAVQ